MALVWNNSLIFVPGPDPDSGDISLGRGVHDFVAVKDVAIIVIFIAVVRPRFWTMVCPVGVAWNSGWLRIPDAQ